VSLIKVNVTVAKYISCSLNSLGVFWPFDTKLGVWVVYNKKTVWHASQIYFIKVKVTVVEYVN